MSESIDARLRRSNIVADDIDVPPVAFLIERLERDGPRGRRRRWRHPLVVVAIGLTLTGSAAATVAALTDGPSTGLVEQSRPGASSVGRISGLLERFDPDWNDPTERAEGEVPGLGDAGPISGATFRREGFDIDIVSDTKTICFTAHLPGRPLSGLDCGMLPIRFDMIPIAAGSDGPKPTRTLFYAVAPDGVSDFVVTTTDGSVSRAAFTDNVAAVSFHGGAEVRSWSWTLPDGRRATQQTGGRLRIERP